MAVLHRFYCTVESHKFKVLGTRVLFLIFNSLNYKEVGINIYKCIYPIKMIVISLFVFLSNISFGRVKGKSQGDFSFMHTKHMFL